MIENNLTDAAADSSSSSANNKDCCCSARLFIEGRDQNITVRRHKQQRKMPRKPCTANPRIRFDPVVNIRYVDKLNQPYAGWITRKIINEKEYVVTKVGFALSNEFVDCKVDLEEQVAEIEARRSISPYFPFKRAYIQTKTTGPLIRVQWDPIATTTLATLPVSCFFVSSVCWTISFSFLLIDLKFSTFFCQTNVNWLTLFLFIQFDFGVDCWLVDEEEPSFQSTVVNAEVQASRDLVEEDQQSQQQLRVIPEVCHSIRFSLCFFLENNQMTT